MPEILKETFEIKAAAARPKRYYDTGIPIGDSSLSSEFMPSWEVDYLYGTFREFREHHTGSYFAPQKIPQLDFTVEFQSFCSKVDKNGVLMKDFIPQELKDVTSLLSLEHAWDSAEPSIAADDTVLQVKPDYLLLEVKENNVDFLKENFEIEVFEVKPGSIDELGNAILLEIPLAFHDPSSGEALHQGHVEYWFNITVDEKVEPEYFCASSIVADKKRNKLADHILPYPENCPEYSKAKNLYVDDVIDVEEPC